jgi:hypothetical protein
MTHFKKRDKLALVTLGLVCAVETVLVGSAEVVANAPRISRILMDTLRRDPCALLTAILPTEGKGCVDLRNPAGQLVVKPVVHDGSKHVKLLRPGQLCPGNIVGVDERPGSANRTVVSMRIDLEGKDEETLTFEGWYDGYDMDSKGRVIGTIGKGCGPEIQGRVRLVGGKWRVIGPTTSGCSD